MNMPFWRVVRVATNTVTGEVTRKRLPYGATERHIAEGYVAYLSQWGEGARPADPDVQWTYELVDSWEVD